MDVDEDKKDEILDFSRSCPYLDTVDRTVLDFDFEKICSLTLANFNVYACLACGKYFQGRGRSSPAYFHCLNEDHHIYIHLHTQKVRQRSLPVHNIHGPSFHLCPPNIDILSSRKLPSNRLFSWGHQGNSPVFICIYFWACPLFI